MKHHLIAITLLIVTATLAQADDLFDTYDKNDDGNVSFNEYLDMKEGRINETRRHRERARFDRADLNLDGTLSQKEFDFWRNPDNRQDESEKGEENRPRDRGDHDEDGEHPRIERDRE